MASIPGFLNLKSVLRLLWSSEHKLGSCEEQTTPFRQSSSVENSKYSAFWSWTIVKTAGSGQVGFDIQKEEQKTLQLLIRVLKNREMVAWGKRRSEVKWQYGFWGLQSSSSPMEESSQKTRVRDGVSSDSNSGHLNFCLGGTFPVSDREPHLEIWRRSQYR